jgi:hypothetical protein
MEALLNRSDRRRYSLATHELERRWKAVRERMAARGIDFLVVQSQQRYAGGYFYDLRRFLCIADTYVITRSGAVPIYKPLSDDDDIAVIG